MKLSEFVEKMASRRGQYTEVRREEAVELFNSLTKQLGFTVEVTEDDGDMVGFKVTTRFHLSRSELAEYDD